MNLTPDDISAILGVTKPFLVLVPVLLLILGLEIYRWYIPSYICHICRDPKRMLRKQEYMDNAGAHRTCLDRSLAEESEQ
jgi:hypothetical protein